MWLKQTLTACAAALALCGCSREIDFEYLDIEPLTVIEAELTPDGAKVGITLTTPMDEPMNLTRLTDATVTLTDLESGESNRLVADTDGYYRNHLAGIDGHHYRLTVQRKGKQFEAETEMFGPTTIESLAFNWISMPYDDVAVLQGQFTDNAASLGDCYWVKIYRNGEIYRWGEIDDRGASGGLCTYMTMTSRKDLDQEDDETALRQGDVVTMRVCRISTAMHNYLEALANDSNGPAMFTGDRCLGYFLASSPVEKSIVFHPDEIPKYQ